MFVIYRFYSGGSTSYKGLLYPRLPIVVTVTVRGIDLVYSALYGEVSGFPGFRASFWEFHT